MRITLEDLRSLDLPGDVVVAVGDGLERHYPRTIKVIEVIQKYEKIPSRNPEGKPEFLLTMSEPARIVVLGK